MTVFICDSCPTRSADLALPPSNWDWAFDSEDEARYRCPTCGWSRPLVDTERTWKEYDEFH